MRLKLGICFIRAYFELNSPLREIFSPEIEFILRHWIKAVWQATVNLPAETGGPVICPNKLIADIKHSFNLFK